MKKILRALFIFFASLDKDHGWNACQKKLYSLLNIKYSCHS